MKNILRKMSLAPYLLLCASLVCGVPTNSDAALVISPSTINLLPNQANQAVSLSITGGDVLSAMNFAVAMGDGGATIGGVDTAATVPTITGLNLITGTIFAGGSTADSFNISGLLVGEQVDIPGNVNGTGVIANIVFDTTALAASGPFTMSMSIPSSPVQATSFVAPGGGLISYTPSQISLNVVPEPSAFLMVGLIGVGSILAKRAARRRAKGQRES